MQAADEAPIGEHRARSRITAQTNFLDPKSDRFRIIGLRQRQLDHRPQYVAGYYRTTLGSVLIRRGVTWCTSPGMAPLPSPPSGARHPRGSSRTPPTAALN